MIAIGFLFNYLKNSILLVKKNNLKKSFDNKNHGLKHNPLRLKLTLENNKILLGIVKFKLNLK